MYYVFCVLFKLLHMYILATC